MIIASRVRQRLADDGVTFDLRGALLAERVEVALLVADLLDRQDVDVDAHLLQIDGRLVGHLLCEGLPVRVDLFDRQRAEDRAQVAFERLEDHALDLLGGMPRKRSEAPRSDTSSPAIFTLATASTVTATPSFV